MCHAVVDPTAAAGVPRGLLTLVRKANEAFVEDVDGSWSPVGAGARIASLRRRYALRSGVGSTSRVLLRLRRRFDLRRFDFGRRLFAGGFAASVNDCVVAVLTITLPKLKLAELTVNCGLGAAVLVPLKVTCAVEPVDESLLMVS